MEKILTFQTKHVLEILSSKFSINKNVCDNLRSASSVPFKYVMLDVL